MYYAASLAQIVRNVIPQHILIIFQGVKVRIRGSLTGQPLAITYKLDIAQAGSYATVAVGIEGIEIDGHVAEAAGVDHHRIQDRIDLTSLKNCIYNALKNCEETQNYTGWIRADMAEPEFSYPYILEYQEFIFKYLDLTTIEYTKKFRIKMVVDGLQYYTDRYSWNAGGTINKVVENAKQKIVDEFSEGAFTAYTIRLEEISQKGKIYEIVVKFRIENSSYVEHQYLGLTNSFPVQVLKLRVEVPGNLKLSECKYNIFSHSVDRVPSRSQDIVPVNNIIEKDFKKLVIGERYNIEWTIK